MNVSNRTIFKGDNLHILRGIDPAMIDLIYLDPPFNSNKNYQVPIGREAAGAAFKDSWTLSDLYNAWHGQLGEHHPHSIPQYLLPSSRILSASNHISL